MVSRRLRETPHDVRAIINELEKALNILDANRRRVGDAKHGVYAFYDYDGEPVYVGQTSEQLRVRIQRHLTNKRTDAVAMNVLDPFEVADIEMWPFWTLDGQPVSVVKSTLASAEYTVFQKLLEESTFSAVLNEKPPATVSSIPLPESVRRRIIPDPIFEQRKHPDVRVARRASTIAKLAQVISERAVHPGLRNTLLTQARRLEHLAAQRLKEVGGPPRPGNPRETKI